MTDRLIIQGGKKLSGTLQDSFSKKKLGTNHSKLQSTMVNFLQVFLQVLLCAV
ncbi:hypothetical protein JI528_15895 [Listeria monocytogenes]|nr:hypothetical protein [Listeria monocytogenes]